MNVDQRSLINMAIQRARTLSYKSPHEIFQDERIFAENNILVSDETKEAIADLLPKLVAEQSKIRLIAKRRQAGARAARATKKGPKVKAPRDERKKGGRDR